MVVAITLTAAVIVAVLAAAVGGDGVCVWSFLKILSTPKQSDCNLTCELFFENGLFWLR